MIGVSWRVPGPWRAPALSLSLLLAAGALPTVTRAQEPLPDLQSLVLLDRVVATVNDAVILQSEILVQTVGEIRTTERERGRALQPQERMILFLRNLRRKIDQHTLAQAAKTLGILPPERVEAIFQDQLRQEERELVRELGTYQKLSEEQARQGRTWQTYEREQRVTKMAELTEALAVSTRLQNQHHLFITPRMMREFYRRNIDQFVHGSRAILGSVAFVGPDAAAAAAEARAVWENELLTPDQLAERFKDRGAIAPETLLIDDETRKTRRLDQVEFALAGPRNRVSDPIQGDGNARLWKILDFVEERSEAFEDPGVQQIIRNHMERAVMDRLLDQTVRRSRERTEVWEPADLRRR